MHSMNDSGFIFCELDNDYFQEESAYVIDSMMTGIMISYEEASQKSRRTLYTDIFAQQAQCLEVIQELQ